MEKRDTKTGMRSNEVNVRKLRQPGRRMSWNFGERVYRVSSTHACNARPGRARRGYRALAKGRREERRREDGRGAHDKERRLEKEQ